ncbi:MAG: carboxypeptidase-like regulatory domain-containing protein [Bacteroidetes bacterium]|nr:carboxypeptidase-like regulatory domain-containing protein [Bacteroidota bacterium]
MIGWPKSIRTLLFLLCVCTKVLAQHTIVKGKITDAESGEALPFITVFFKNTNIGTSTDFEGFYELKTTQKTDSISAKSIGYITASKKIIQGKVQEINFALQPNSNSLNEVVVKPGVNKAIRIIRNAQSNRKKYNIEKLEQYEYESFTKIQIAVDNISEKFKKRKIFREMESLFDTISSLKADTNAIPVLPVFVSETLSDYYYNKSPYRTKEIIKATRIKGVGVGEESYVAQVLGSSFQQYNFYENNLYLFDKDFISPLSILSLTYYHYALLDSLEIEGHKTYKIRVWPKNKKDLVFTGHIWIQDTSFALKQVSLEISKEANINFIEKIKIQQEMTEVEKDAWLPSKTRVLIDVSELTNNSLGMIGTYYTSTKNQKVNIKHDAKFFEQKVEVKADAYSKNDKFWDTSRHEKLSNADIKIYNLVDSFKNKPLIKTYVDVAEIIAEGYKPIAKGNIEIGPYISIIGFNPLEGFRVRAGVRTTEKLFPNSMIETFCAYGFGDKKIKYGLDAVWVLDRKRWSKAGFGIKNDVDLLGVTDDPFVTSSLYKSLNTLGSYRLNYTFEYKIFAEREFFKGITFKANMRHNDYQFEPNSKFNFAYYKNPETDHISNKFSVTTLNLVTKISLKQQFVYRHVDRYNFGNLKQPVITLSYTKGMKIINGQYEFDKIGFKIWQYNSWANFGNFEYTIQAGKTFGTIPYPILEVARGNESPNSSFYGYNMMRFFEFVSDQYVSLHYEHNDNGLIFNRIPLIKDLKWRFFYNVKTIYGSLNNKNLNLVPPSDAYGKEVTNIGRYKYNTPYLELGYGIENIFKFVRVDFIHRMTYLYKDKAKPFGVKFNFVFKF